MFTYVFIHYFIKIDPKIINSLDIHNCFIKFISNLLIFYGNYTISLNMYTICLNLK